VWLEVAEIGPWMSTVGGAKKRGIERLIHHVADIVVVVAKSGHQGRAGRELPGGASVQIGGLVSGVTSVLLKGRQ